MDQAPGSNNVRNISNQTGYPLFNPHMRRQLEASVSELTDRPEDVVSTIEATICKTVVAAVRRGAAKIGEALGNKITETVDRAFNE